MTMFTEAFMLNALLAGAAIAAACGVLGCFVVWRRMSYYGDAIGHSALLGVAMSLALQIDVRLGVLAVALAVAALLIVLQRRAEISLDTLLGVMSSGVLAAGLIAVALLGITPNLESFLFGDILAISREEVFLTLGFAALVVGILAWQWHALTLMALNEDIAQVEGVPVAKLRALLMLLVAVTVALAIKLVGVLLISALLVIPAAASRALAKTPTTMAAMAAAIGVFCVAAGLYASLHSDTPAGPAIIVSAVVVFLLSAVRRA